MHLLLQKMGGTIICSDTVPLKKLLMTLHTSKINFVVNSADFEQFIRHILINKFFFKEVCFRQPNVLDQQSRIL